MTTFSDNFSARVFSIADSQSFEKLALELFDFQYNHVQVYQHYCDLLGRPKPQTLYEIPFLPIESFKHHDVSANLAAPSESDLLFLSSGTTQMQRAKHRVLSPAIYHHSALTTFQTTFGSLENLVICALLPNYIQQGNSSLVYMVDLLIGETKDVNSGFFLEDTQSMMKSIRKAKETGKNVVLFGVSYALLDLAEQQVDLSGVVVIETGGMKGRRREMLKEELHQCLKTGLNVNDIYSEYGMTELLSQCYCKNNEPFFAPPWMKILLRDERDPLSFLEENSTKTGGISVIDLANVFSCSFINTQDLGRFKGAGFHLLGRFDYADIRGCNQLVL